jgi:hypothetical protein
MVNSNGLEDPADGKIILPISFTFEKIHKEFLSLKLFNLSLTCMKSYFYTMF